MNSPIANCAAAFRFLTRLPVPFFQDVEPSLADAAGFFPLVGAVIGVAGALVRRWLAPHLPTQVVALAVVTSFVLLTAGLHEDGLADVADAFGGGWSREQVLVILKDSRIGSFGALAIACSVLGRVLLISALPASHASAAIICAEMLSRWTVLPLAYALGPARSGEGQGARIAQRVSVLTIFGGTLFAGAISAWLLRSSFWLPWLVCGILTLLSGMYYKRRIGGVTGDCFGATCQIAAIAVYACEVWQ